MGQGEGQVLGQELLDVGALDIVGLLKLNDAEDLIELSAYHWTFLAVSLGARGIEWYVRGWT